MFNISKEDCVTTDQKLLWNIMTTLQPKKTVSKPVVVKKAKPTAKRQTKNKSKRVDNKKIVYKQKPDKN